jgi:RimJ/RimL family protein N-acetyltransferase
MPVPFAGDCRCEGANLRRLDEFLPARQGDTVLRRLRASDVVRFHGYRSDATLATYQGWSAMTREQAEAFVAQMAPVAELVPGDWVQFAIAEAGSDRLIGDVGAHLEADGAAAELGFTLCREAQGRGHAIRAVEAARSLIFTSTAAGLVRAVTDARNQGSVRVLERAGFKRLAERQALFKGERCTEFVYVCHRSAT